MAQCVGVCILFSSTYFDNICMFAVFYRSRDPAVLGTCDIVVDVGAVYDHEKKRYDHHQRCVIKIVLINLKFLFSFPHFPESLKRLLEV